MPLRCLKLSSNVSKSNHSRMRVKSCWMEVDWQSMGNVSHQMGVESSQVAVKLKSISNWSQILVVTKALRWFQNRLSEWVGVYWSKRWWKVVTTGAIRRAKLQSNHHHQQTNTQFFLQAGCPSCRPTNSVKALKGKISHSLDLFTPSSPGVFQLCLWPLIAPGYLGGGLTCLSSALWCQYPKHEEHLDCKISCFGNPKRFPLQAFGGPGLTWSNLQKNRQVKQKPNVVVWSEKVRKIGIPSAERS